MEPVGGGDEPGRLDAAAGKKQRVRHLAKGETGGEGRHREQGRPGQHLPQRSSELLVGNRLRCHPVHGTPERVGGERVTDGADGVVDGDPAQILPAVSQPPADTQSEGWEHFGESTARGRENHSEADVNHADTLPIC